MVQSEINDDNWMQFMTDEQREEYEKTMRYVEKGQERKKRMTHLKRILEKVQIWEEEMEGSFKGIEYKMEQNLFGSETPYCYIVFKKENISDAVLDMDTGEFSWNDKRYTQCDQLLHDITNKTH